ncbi:DUF423 domain-containing protein [Paenibacillus sp. CAU 1782]
MQTLLLLGSACMAIAVILGAFGGHALKRKLAPDKLDVYLIGIQYHIAHALGLLLLGALSPALVNGDLIQLAGWLLFAGIVLFSGSLYALALTGVKRLGIITPLGGLSFIAGWVVVVIAVL